MYWVIVPHFLQSSWPRSLPYSILRAVWHGWSRGLRSSSSFVLSPNRRLPRLLQRHRTAFLRECQGKVGSGNQASQSKVRSIIIPDWRPKLSATHEGCKVLKTNEPKMAHDSWLDWHRFTPSPQIIRTPFLLVGTQMDLRTDQKELDKLAKNR